MEHVVIIQIFSQNFLKTFSSAGVSTFTSIHTSEEAKAPFLFNQPLSDAIINRQRKYHIRTILCHKNN